MPVAGKLLRAIDEAMRKDDGNQFRIYQRTTFSQIEDAYRADDGIRTHLGASIIGGSCDRQLWYSFRWVEKAHPEPKMLRLWNRGHLEEARFYALLMTAGVQTWMNDPTTGKQFKVSTVGGHFGGSGDGVSYGVPDVPGIYVLNEFKTHNDKSFQELVRKGVQDAKPAHYVQMNTYMKGMGLSWALYMAVNKNDDGLHAEVLSYNQQVADTYEQRAVYIIFSPAPPKGISNSPSWYECKFCDFKNVCHYNKAPARNCRTCKYAEIINGGWACGHFIHPRMGEPLTKEEQVKGCDEYQKLETL